MHCQYGWSYGVGLAIRAGAPSCNSAEGPVVDHAALKIDLADPHGPARAYGISKRGNLLRVQTSAKAWGCVGGRVDSVSPGVISTGAGRQEIEGPAGKFIDMSPVNRVGTPQDLVNAVSFLASAESSFITGNDLVVGWRCRFIGTMGYLESLRVDQYERLHLESRKINIKGSGLPDKLSTAPCR